MSAAGIMDERYPLMGSVPVEKLTPMMQQYFSIKSQYLDYILFYRLGDFYEMFFDDALRASDILEIVLTGRGSVGDQKIPMCGVPFHALDTYLKRAFERGLSIAICEQEEAPEGKGIAKREVVRIITPGTVFNSDLLRYDESNYVASVYRMMDGRYQLEYADISTGVRRKTILSPGELKNELSRIAPNEILYFSDNLDSALSKEIGATTDLCRIPHFDPNPAEMLEHYLTYTAKQPLTHIGAATEYSPHSNMLLDSGSIRNLELVESMSTKKKKGSLLGVMDRTMTAMGARLLRESLKAPLLDLELISRRQDYVAYLCENYWERSNTRSLLKGIYDLERLVTKLVYGTLQYRDLISIKNSLLAIGELKRTANPDFEDFFRDLDSLPALSRLIDDAVEETGEGIKAGYSAPLDEVRGFLNGGKKWLLELEQREKETTGIRTLKVSYNKVFGYYIEVSKSFAEKVPEHYIRRQTLVNSERFVTEELKELEEKVLRASESLTKLEKQLFDQIKAKVHEAIEALKTNALRIAHIDMLASFAETAYIKSYVRPVVNASNEIRIEAGRHPVIESFAEYIPNDAYMDDLDNKIAILTGPNMAGKSSYLRQNALIIILAQIGSFVPAKCAEIGLIDSIFTRVGASDDLAEGRSTFMVEMKELAYILDHQTDRSFVILDEIGRGTSTFDGLSIALSVIEYLAKRRSKVMFATHYHELTVLEGKVPGVLNYRIEVKKEKSEIIFLRRIVRGSEKRSYGIEVAHLAGVSDEVVTRAKQILSQLDRGETALLESKISMLDSDIPDCGRFAQHIGYGEVEDDGKAPKCEGDPTRELCLDILSALEATDMDDISPKEAWGILSELKEKARRRKG